MSAQFGGERKERRSFMNAGRKSRRSFRVLPALRSLEQTLLKLLQVRVLLPFVDKAAGAN